MTAYSQMTNSNDACGRYSALYLFESWPYNPAAYDASFTTWQGKAEVTDCKT